jgi:hypothetical protein
MHEYDPVSARPARKLEEPLAAIASELLVRAGGGLDLNPPYVVERLAAVLKHAERHEIGRLLRIVIAAPAGLDVKHHIPLSAQEPRRSGLPAPAPGLTSHLPP